MSTSPFFTMISVSVAMTTSRVNMMVVLVMFTHNQIAILRTHYFRLNIR